MPPKRGPEGDEARMERVISETLRGLKEGMTEDEVRRFDEDIEVQGWYDERKKVYVLKMAVSGVGGHHQSYAKLPKVGEIKQFVTNSFAALNIKASDQGSPQTVCPPDQGVDEMKQP